MKNIGIVSIALLAFASQAQAYFPHGTAPAGVAAPLLTNSTVNFGATTRTGRGGVQLSSQDFTTTAVQPVTFSGAGLMSPTKPACTSWRQPVFVSNSSGRTGSDFTLIANNTAEGATAITPVPTSGGQGNLAGDYVWNIQCDGDGGASNVAQLTYHTVANQVNIGTADRTDFGVYPTNFGNTAGAKIAFSTGYVHTDRLLIGFGSTSVTNAVTVTNADVNKPARLTNFNAQNANLLNVDDLIVSGDLSAGAFTSQPTCLMCVTDGAGAPSNVNFHRDFGYFSEALLAGQSRGFFRADGCVATCGMYDSGVDYVSNGINEGKGSSATVQNTWFRHIFENFISLGNSGDLLGNGWKLIDVQLIAPMTNNPFIHPDMGQIGDGGTVLNHQATGLFQATAGGDTFAQGFPFNGTAIGGVTDYTGYVDDGTGAHGPGKVATFVTGATGASFPGARIYASSGSPMAASDMVMMTSCVGTCGQGATKVNLNLASDVNIGSPASPVHFYGITQVGWTINGLVYAGGTFHGVNFAGEQGTNVTKNFGLVSSLPNPFYETSFTGSASGTTLTISDTPTNNIPGVVVPAIGGRLKYSGCDYCGVGIDHQLTGTTNGPGTYLLTSSVGTLTSQAMKTSTSYPVSGAARFDIAACDRPQLHGGTHDVSSGYAEGGFVQVGGTCSNFTFTHTPTTVAADFQTGVLPSVTLALRSGTYWNGRTPAQIEAEHCNAMLPAAGHQLDDGAGGWYGPYTATGEKNDGRGHAVLGCGIH